MKNKNKKRRLKKWVKGLLLALLIIILCLIILVIEKIIKNDDIVLKKNLNIEINTKTSIGDLIEDSKVEIKNMDDIVATDKLGNKKVIIHYLKDGKDIEKQVTVKIIDTTLPVIEVEDELLVSLNSEASLEELILIKDNSNEEISPIIDGDYDFTKIGEYKVNIKATDSSNNTISKEITIKVLDNKLSYNSDGSLKDGVYGTSKGYTVKVENGVATVDGNIIVNKTYSLPADYKPQSPYVEIYAGYCTDCIEDYVMEAFLEMEKDAEKEGLSMRIGSGYRSYNTQVNLYNSYMAKDGKEEADTYSARAGYSEHQSGLCFDIYPDGPSFTNTKEGKWVNDNAYKYGLVIRFPKGKDEYTGYTYESWHLRYVGKDLAKILYNDGDWLSLEEYYGLESVYPD